MGIDGSSDSDDDDLGCPDEALPWFDYLIGWTLVIGTAISFIPQHVRIILRRSHAGISLLFVCTASFTSVCFVLSYLSEDFEQAFHCCQEGNAYYCSGNLLPFLKLFMIFLAENLILVLYLFFFDRDWIKNRGQDPRKEWRVSLSITLVMFCFEVLCILFFLGIIYRKGIDSKAMSIFGKIMVAFASLGTVVQWTPQIIKTYQLKELGSLSILMVALQSIGAFLGAYFFYASGTPWYTWLPFIIMGFLLVILLIEALYFERWGNKTATTSSTSISVPTQQPSAHGGPGTAADDQSAPLLGGNEDDSPLRAKDATGQVEEAEEEEEEEEDTPSGYVRHSQVELQPSV